MRGVGGQEAGENPEGAGMTYCEPQVLRVKHTRMGTGKRGPPSGP